MLEQKQEWYYCFSNEDQSDVTTNQESEYVTIALPGP